MEGTLKIHPIESHAEGVIFYGGKWSLFSPLRHDCDIHMIFFTEYFYKHNSSPLGKFSLDMPLDSLSRVNNTSC